jgi:hypothetical protein
MVHTQKTNRRTIGTSAIRCVHVNVLLANLSRPYTSRARSPDSLNSTASSCTARPQHILAAFSSSKNHIRTRRENDPPPTLHRKRARHLPPPCSPRPCRESSILLPVVLVLHLRHLSEGQLSCNMLSWTLYSLTPSHHLGFYSSLAALPLLLLSDILFLRLFKKTTSLQAISRSHVILLHAQLDLDLNATAARQAPHATRHRLVVCRHSSRQLYAPHETGPSPQDEHDCPSFPSVTESFPEPANGFEGSDSDEAECMASDFIF